MRENRGLIWHGDGKTVNGYVAHAGQQILQRLGMQWNVDSVYRLAPHSRIHDRWRKRMGHGIAGDPVHSGGSVDLVDAIGAAQILRGDLPGRGFFVLVHRRKREHTSGADPEYA